MIQETVDSSKRDFLVLSATATAAGGAAVGIVPLIGSLKPAADVMALSSVEVDISSVQEGQSITVMWRGKPVFIRRRTKREIDAARKVKISDLVDREEDTARVKKGKDEWLVVIGICTHLGCVPLGYQGEYDGWFCPCHGSHYDTSGRIRKGPAPRNLDVPEYVFLSESVIKIG